MFLEIQWKTFDNNTTIPANNNCKLFDKVIRSRKLMINIIKTFIEMASTTSFQNDR